MRFYADENFPRRTVEELRRIGHDVLTAFEDGRANRSVPDRDLLGRATELGRVVVTLNRRDFIRLHQTQSDHAGIVVCTEDQDRVRQARSIDSKIKQFPDLIGTLIRIDRPA